MTNQIKSIDKIARELQRDVLYLTFEKNEQDNSRSWEGIRSPRTRIIKWLDMNNIDWMQCTPISCFGSGAVYKGQLYIDLPINGDDPTYQKLINYLEDGNNRVKDEFGYTRFWIVPLHHAMRNQYLDCITL